MIIRKGHPGKGLYALPGGHVEWDENFLEAALRELSEETKIQLGKVEAVKPILRRALKAEKMFDHPNRAERTRIISMAHFFDLGEGPLPFVEGGDDASHALWVPVADLHEIEEKIFDDHFDIINYFVSRI